MKGCVPGHVYLVYICHTWDLELLPFFFTALYGTKVLATARPPVFRQADHSLDGPNQGI